MRWLVTVPGLCCSCGKNCAIVDCCGWSAEVNTERSSRDTDKNLQLYTDIVNELLQVSSFGTIFDWNLCIVKDRSWNLARS
jgi:hypothetical protein